jgi:hypothetical protein
MQKFQFFTASPLKMRACGTGRKFAEYDQRVSFELQKTSGWKEDTVCHHIRPMSDHRVQEKWKDKFLETNENWSTWRQPQEGLEYKSESISLTSTRTRFQADNKSKQDYSYR